MFGDSNYWETNWEILLLRKLLIVTKDLKSYERRKIHKNWSREMIDNHHRIKMVLLKKETKRRRIERRRRSEIRLRKKNQKWLMSKKWRNLLMMIEKNESVKLKDHFLSMISITSNSFFELSFLLSIFILSLCALKMLCPNPMITWQVFGFYLFLRDGRRRKGGFKWSILETKELKTLGLKRECFLFPAIHKSE